MATMKNVEIIKDIERVNQGVTPYYRGVAPIMFRNRQYTNQGCPVGMIEYEDNVIADNETKIKIENLMEKSGCELDEAMRVCATEEGATHMYEDFFQVAYWRV